MRMRRFVAGAAIAAAVAAAATPLPGLAQEASPPAESGQGAGVQGARVLPRTGGGPADDPRPLAAAAAAVLVGTAGFALAARRKRPRRSSGGAGAP